MSTNVFVESSCYAVGLLPLHDLRADSLIRPIASRSVIQLLSNNHCHSNNPDYNFLLHVSFTSQRSELHCKQAFLFTLYLMTCTVIVF